MKKSMKVFAGFFVVAIILFQIGAHGLDANAANRVYADGVTVEAGDEFTVPVMIENNEGFMGFSIIVTYDADAFTPLSVSKGSILLGMLNDSIETSKNNSFKVVFTGTENIFENGELFSIKFAVSNDASGEKHSIELSYLPNDTFAEGWEACAFNCRDIEAIVTVDGTTLPTTTQEATTEPAESTTKELHELTTKDSQEATTENEPGISDPKEEKLLSVRMREWVNGFVKPLNYILGVFVIPVAFVISLFE